MPDNIQGGRIMHDTMLSYKLIYKLYISLNVTLRNDSQVN